jgi:PsbP
MLRKGRVPPEVNEDMKISNAIASLLLLLPLLTLVPNPSFSQVTFDNLTAESGLTELDRQKVQEQQEKALLRQQQNWSTYEDPILGMQFEYPSWWDKIDPTTKNSIEFYDNPSTHASMKYFLPPLPEEMNTLDKFMRQMMTELRPPDAQNLSVNKTSTIGVDDIPAYKVESEETIMDLHVKNIHYLAIDNSTGTGYMISFDVSNMEKAQEDVPLFERMVESFKIFRLSTFSSLFSISFRVSTI